MWDQGSFLAVLPIRDWLAQCLGLFKGGILSCTVCTQTKQCCAAYKDFSLPCNCPVCCQPGCHRRANTFLACAPVCCTRHCLYFIHWYLGSAPDCSTWTLVCLEVMGHHYYPRQEPSIPLASVFSSTWRWMYVEGLSVQWGINILQPFRDSLAFQRPPVTNVIRRPSWILWRPLISDSPGKQTYCKTVHIYDSSLANAETQVLLNCLASVVFCHARALIVSFFSTL